MFKRLFIAIILLGLIVGGIVWFKFFRDEMIAQYLGGMVPPPVPVGAEVVETITWQPGIEAVGSALAAQGVDLAIETGGVVRELHFNANDTLEKGQDLVQLDDDSERAALAASEALLKVAVTDAERAQTLQKRGAGSATAAESAAAQTESVRAQVAQSQTALDRKKLTAPFAGVIGIPKIEVGDYVAPGQIYATLQDLGQMRVDFSVPEQQLPSLKRGGKVTATSEVGAFSAEGTITGIEPIVDANTRMVLVRATVDNTHGDIVPGQFLRVNIQLPQEEGVIAVPQTAVSSTLYGDSLFVIRPAEAKEGAPAANATPDADADKAAEPALVAEQVFVKLGRRNGSRIEVVEGLKAGDQIVTNGQNRLSPGAKVKIDNSVALDQSLAQ